MTKFRELFESSKEFFFTNDEEGINDLTNYLNKHHKGEFDMYIGRGDSIAHGMKFTGKMSKKLQSLIDDVYCDEENPEDCY